MQGRESNNFAEEFEGMRYNAVMNTEYGQLLVLEIFMGYGVKIVLIAKHTACHYQFLVFEKIRQQ